MDISIECTDSEGGDDYDEDVQALARRNALHSWTYCSKHLHTYQDMRIAWYVYVFDQSTYNISFIFCDLHNK